MVLVLAASAFILATVGLALLIEPLPGWYYHCAWWSTIVVVDDVNRRLAGRSLIRDRPREFLALSGVSVVWWTLFEALNLRLGNWYYVMDHPGLWVRFLGGVVAFATVLPGILETKELIENMGWLRSLRVAPLRWSGGKQRACWAVGAASFLLPLLWPSAFFPLTWGSFVFLVEPWNRRHARASFLRDLEAGDAGPFCRTLLAGLVCGGLWEVWNYWARTKWIYTVPGFEGWKLFEMPLLGFFGFPPFAVECVVVVRFLEALWARVSHRWGRVWPAAAAIVFGGAACLFVFLAVDPVTVDSFYVPVERLEVLPVETRVRLSALGLKSQEKLLRAFRTPESRLEWVARSGLPQEELRLLRDRVALVVHRGIGQDRALQLERLGVRTLDDLARLQPDALAAVLRTQGSSARDRFLERRVRAWFTGLPEGHLRTGAPWP